jgi:hypothetical protein
MGRAAALKAPHTGRFRPPEVDAAAAFLAITGMATARRRGPRGKRDADSTRQRLLLAAFAAFARETASDSGVAFARS